MLPDLPLAPPSPPSHDRQAARVSIRFGRKRRLEAEVAVTSTGLLSIGALVSAILLSTAVLVGVATRSRHR